MWKYLINGQEVSFSSDQESERLSAIATAESKNYSIELISKPTEEEVSKAPESAFSQVISGEVPEVEEDFTQDPVESADAVSETVAQEDTVLPLEDGSSDFQPIPLGDGAIPDVGGSVPFSIGGREATEEEYRAYEKQRNIENFEETTDWSFFKETGKKIESAAIRALGKLARIPTALNEAKFAYDKAFAPKEVQERINKLPPKAQQAIANAMGGGFGAGAQFGVAMQNLANEGLVAYEQSLKDAEKIEETLTKFDTTIVEEYGKGNIVGATVRTASDAIGSLPSLVQAMIPYVGIASIFAGEAAGALGEAQEEGEDLDLKTLGYGLVRGASEGLLEVTTKKIGKGLFKALKDKPKDLVVKDLKDIALNIGKEYGAEGLSESATLTINDAADLLILGREDAFDGYLAELGDTFLVGAAMGGGVSSTGAGVRLFKQTIQSKKVNNDLAKTQYKSLKDAYTDIEVAAGMVDLSLNPATRAFLDNELKAEVDSGNITIEESESIKKNFADTQSAANKVKRSSISDANSEEATELLAEKTRLEAEIKSIEDKTLSAPQQLRVETIDGLLGKLVDQSAQESIAEIKTKAAEKATVATERADAILKQLGSEGVKKVKNTEAMSEFFANLNAEDQAIYEEAKADAIAKGDKTFKIGESDYSVDGDFTSNLEGGDAAGVYVTRIDGKTEVIINEDVAFDTGVVNTAAHEVLHYALEQTLKSGETDIAQLKVGTALEGFLDTLEISKDNKILQQRLDQYKADKRISDGNTAEEVLNVLSEAMLDGDIVYKETMATKLMDLGRRLMSSLGYKVKFNSGKDVFNFIKDYNRAIKKGKLSRGLEKSLKEGIKGKLTETKITDAKKAPSVKKSAPTRKAASIEALEEAYFDLQDQVAEDPDNLALYEKMEQAGRDLDAAEAAPAEEVSVDVEAVQEAPKKVIVRPKADKSKRKYSIDKEIKKELEPKIAEAQKLNKELVVQEKKLNEDAIKAIEAIPDKEVKRTEKDRRIAELRNNPKRVRKSNELNKLEREISAELKTPIDKAVNLFTRLYYDKISENAKAAVTREQFKESARAEITSITINEFKPETVNRAGETIINDIEDIIFQRGGLRLRNLAERLGVIGRDQGIARGAEALTKIAAADVDTSFDANDKDSVLSEEKRKVSALLASESRYDQAREQVIEFWKENEGNTKVENFKKLPNLINNILAEMFGVTESTLAARSGNLNKQDYRNAIKGFTEKQAVFTIKEGDTKKEVRVPLSEVSAFQDGLNEKKAANKDFSYKREANESIAEALLRFLPKTSADDYTYASGRKGRFSGKSTGLPKNLLELAYKIEGRKTTGIGNVERAAQKLTIEEIYDAIGAVVNSEGNIVQKSGVSGRSKEGQTLLGLIKLTGRMVTNEISRTETDLDPMTKMDIAAGKNRLMYSMNRKLGRGLDAIGIDVDITLSEDNVNNTRNLFTELSEELGAQETIEYLVPLVSRGYGTFYTKDGEVIFKPGRFSIFKNREDFFKNIGLEEFKGFKPGDRKVVIDDQDIALKINFDQNAKKLNKFADQIEERQKFAKDQQKGLKKIAEILRAKLQEDFESNKDAVASLLQTMNSNVDGLIRTAAPPKFMFLETNTSEYVYEHSKTASDTLVELSQLIFSKDTKIDFDKRFNEIMEDFVVSIIPKSYDKILNKVFKANGPRVDGRKSDYTKALVKSEDGIPIRYTDPAFTNLLLKEGMAPMDVVPINKKQLQEHLNSVKSSKKLIKGNTNLLPDNLQQKNVTQNETIMRAETFDKAIDLGNSLDQETKGISVWDFDDTLAKTKSSVLYTMPGEVKIYHGGAIKSAKDIKGDFVYFSEEKTQADEYAKGNRGEVTDFVLNENNIVNEEAVFEVIKELGIQPKTKGYKVDELNLYELIDPRFKKESFSKTDLARLAKALKNKGIKAARFSDTNLKSGKEILNIVVFDKSSVKRRGKLNAAEFAKKGDAMLAEGAEFDFSEFSKVVKGSKGPFFEKAMARNKKFGNENVYILTARPANSALAIHEFLKGIGLDIPLANITGLANSDPQAKANWVLDKFAEGYNDFYFADDHIGNVNAVKKVLDVLDVKSKVQQARVKNSLQLSKRFNEIIEEESGIESFKEYQSVKAKLKGKKKGKFKFFIPPSAEDFLGLLYTTLPKGKKGESAMAFYKEHLLDPYGKAITGLRTGRITIGKNYRALKKELGIVPRKLKKTFKYEDENGNMKESLFTKEQAIRVYTFDAQGLEIPGLSNVDLPILVNYVNSNPDLKAFADKLLELNKDTKPKAPSESWPAGTITSDLLNTLNTEGRAELLEVWQQNVDAIFTNVNLNKLEAAYGESYVRALKDSLRRMKTGRNAKPTGNTVTDGIVKWINAAVGNIMFLNRRSAVLQLISFTNFINFEGNNLYQAGKAFANQKQYWKDWTMLMNSDYLVDRRDGLRINVNEADIATTAKENGFQGVLAKILQVGFIPTKMADTAAIATGGATFYRNKVNALIKGGMNKAAAEKQAMQEFVSTAEVSQQSSDPSKISKQQAEPIGRIILAFANTPSQYARIIKRAAQDLKNGRGDAKTHLSRIVYYGVLQNLIFNFLQQAMFTALMGDEDDEDLTEKQEESRNKKMLKTANSMTDGILRGIGVGGAVVSAVKNLAIKFYERSQKTRNQRLAETLKDGVMAISPPISSKLSKIGKVGNSFEWGKKEMEFDDMSLKHPYVTIAANTVAAATGFPADRAVGMAIDAVDIASDETETWMKPLIALGWPKWQLMSEEDTEKEREERKERFEELKEDKEFQELNPTEQRRSVLKKLTKKEQIDILWNAGLSKTQIRKLTKEADRVDKIMGLQDKKQFDKDMEALSRGEDISPDPKVTRPSNKRKNSLK